MQCIYNQLMPQFSKHSYYCSQLSLLSSIHSASVPPLSEPGFCNLAVPNKGDNQYMCLILKLISFLSLTSRRNRCYKSLGLLGFFSEDIAGHGGLGFLYCWFKLNCIWFAKFLKNNRHTTVPISKSVLPLSSPLFSLCF